MCPEKKFSGCNARLPQLLHWLPVRNAILKHTTDLIEYWASRLFARLPISSAESGLLTLCTSNFLWLPSDPAVGQQRPCQSDCLPLNQGDSSFFQPDGFASFAGQTKKAAKNSRFFKTRWAKKLRLQPKPEHKI